MRYQTTCGQGPSFLWVRSPVHRQLLFSKQKMDQVQCQQHSSIASMPMLYADHIATHRACFGLCHARQSQASSWHAAVVTCSVPLACFEPSLLLQDQLWRRWGFHCRCLCQQQLMLSCIHPPGCITKPGHLCYWVHLPSWPGLLA